MSDLNDSENAFPGSSATLLVNKGEDLFALKRHEGEIWKLEAFKYS
jgi:hypothetical protein